MKINKDIPETKSKTKGEIAATFYPDTFHDARWVSGVIDELLVCQDFGVSFIQSEAEEEESEKLLGEGLVRVYSVAENAEDKFKEGDKISLNKYSVEQSAKKQGLAVKTHILPIKDVLMVKYSEEKGIYSPKVENLYQAQKVRNKSEHLQGKGAETPAIDKQEQRSTLEERIDVARNEIMSVYRAFAPDDKENYNDVENTLNKVLTAAAQQGEGKFKEFAGKIKKGIPTVRNELANATQEESRKAKTEVAMQSKAAEKTQAMSGHPEKREKQLEK